MKNLFKNTFIFAIGAAVGSVVTWKLLDTKYKQRSDEEIESVKEAFGKKEEMDKQSDEEDCDDRTMSNKEKPDISSYLKQVKNSGYTNYSNSPEPKRTDGEHNGPYVIPPTEYGEKDGYKKLSFTYYADSIVTDDNDDILENVNEVIGFESLTHFGEYEDDSVFVRNDKFKTDYEILKDNQRYVDCHRSSRH